MEVARVIGTVVSTRKDEALVGYKLLVVELESVHVIAPPSDWWWWTTWAPASPNVCWSPGQQRTCGARPGCANGCYHRRHH